MCENYEIQVLGPVNEVLLEGIQLRLLLQMLSVAALTLQQQGRALGAGTKGPEKLNRRVCQFRYSDFAQK